MLNCFYCYSGLWLFILILYSMKLSLFNHDLNLGVLFFIIMTIIISFIFGCFYRKKIQYTKSAVDYGIKPIIVIVILFIMNFIYANNIPFLSIITGHSSYGDFYGIPVFYVILNAISFYYGINYFNAFLNLEKNKIRNIICYFIIVLMYLLVFSRSTVLFLIISAFILYIMSSNITKKKKLKNNSKKFLIIIVFTAVILYLFGAIGNIRSGYKFNDNSYIERIGLYNNYPSILPKQYMWTYSYLTSPLSNLNYTVIRNKNIEFNYKGFLSELTNRTIGKRLFPNLNYGEDYVIEIGIEQDYFNASTGYFIMYNYAGFYGMIIQYFVLAIISCVLISLANKDYNIGKRNSTFIILLFANSLMFFYNSVNTTTVSWWLIINFVFLLKKPSIRRR